MSLPLRTKSVHTHMPGHVLPHMRANESPKSMVSDQSWSHESRKSYKLRTKSVHTNMPGYILPHMRAHESQKSIVFDQIWLHESPKSEGLRMKIRICGHTHMPGHMLPHMRAHESQKSIVFDQILSHESPKSCDFDQIPLHEMPGRGRLKGLAETAGRSGPFACHSSFGAAVSAVPYPGRGCALGRAHSANGNAQNGCGTILFFQKTDDCEPKARVFNHYLLLSLFCLPIAQSNL